ncbi:hypothetical protein MXB_2020 [Myxobolus squamalis]|nr:hypothetical protein MXB_2020 [Myxobolus squamalis]
MLEYEGDDFEQIFPLTFQIERFSYGEMILINLIEKGEEIKTLFNPYELREVIIGCLDYDFIELQRSTTYKGYYSINHPTIKIFWIVLHSFSLELKKKFLSNIISYLYFLLEFVTGSDKLPIMGMSYLKMSIQPMNVSLDSLPASHTCYNLLDLPPYEEQNQLQQKLEKAIEYCEGFGLI